MKPQTKILAGVALGIAVGAMAKLPGADALQRVLSGLEPLGTAFIRLVTMVVIPLVIASLFVGVASIGDVRRLGRIGSRTLAYFLATTFAAAVIGLTVARVAKLGEGVDRQALLAQGATQIADGAPPKMPGLASTLVSMVPQNPFAAAAQSDLLPLIIAVCIFGAAATVARTERVQPVIAFFTGVNDLAMIVIGWLMHLAPAAVFVLLASTVARTGMDLLGSLLSFALVVVVALFVHLGSTLFLVLHYGARITVGRFVPAIADAVILAFSTASSSAALPVSMAAATSRLDVPGEVASFVLPAGASLNKNGAAAYKAVTAIYIAQLYGLALTPGVLLTIVLISTVAAFAGAGVPGSSLVTTLIVLNALGLGPQAAAGIALVVAIDRPLDMCRTAVNTIGNLVVAAAVAREESEQAS